MGGILSRAEGSPKASQNACRQSVLGSIDLVSTCVDYLVVDELYGSARPVCQPWRAAADLTPGRLSLERRPERWPAMYYVVWEWHPDEGEPFLIE